MKKSDSLGGKTSGKNQTRGKYQKAHNQRYLKESTDVVIL